MRASRHKDATVLGLDVEVGLVRSQSEIFFSVEGLRRVGMVIILLKIHLCGRYWYL